MRSDASNVSDSATPDNMYIVKPDNTIHFNMPTGQYKIMKLPTEKPKEK